MKRYIIGIAISIVLAYLFASFAKLFLSTTQEPTKREIGTVSLSKSLSNVLEVREKVEAVADTSNEDALNDWGLSATIIGTNSLAFLISGNDSLLLKVGDDLEGYELSKIEKTRVLFKSKDKNSWVYMKDAIPKASSSNASQSNQAKDSYAIPNSEFNRFMQNPDRLLSDINITPYFVNNAFGGFQVNFVKRRSFLYVYGLREKDIIVGVNGEKLVSLAEAIGLYQKVMGLKNFSIEILRDNQKKVLNYAIR